MAAEPIDETVPKLPRGRGITLSGAQLVRILGLIAVLVFLLVMQRPCANAVSSFVTGFDGSAGSGSAGSGHAGSGNAGSGHAPAAKAGQAAGSAVRLEDYEALKPGMTDDEIKAAIERARVKAAGSAAPATGIAAPDMR